MILRAVERRVYGLNVELEDSEEEDDVKQAFAALTPRWTPAVLSPAQHRFVSSRARINAVVAGRRSFKTEGAKRRLVLAALEFSSYSDGRFFACAPTQQQAKDIFWDDLKALLPDWALRGGDRRRAVSDSELTIDLVNGARIKVAGLDKPARIEGKDWDGGVITEFGDCKKGIFEAHIRPMMIRGGWIDIEGVPEGRNHWYDLAMAARASDGAKRPALRGAAYHHWTTEEVLHLWLGKEAAEAELAEARGHMDAMVYAQEYRAEFVNFEGRAYYGHTDANLAPEGGARYDPSLPLVLCFDFNREPGVCAYVQELPPSSLPWLARPQRRAPTVTTVVGEVFIKRGSNTRKVCERIIADWAGVHQGDVLLHGDPAGGAKTSQGVAGSDWDIILDTLRPIFGSKLRPRWARSAPLVRARLNSMNARLSAADGSVGLVLDPQKCPMTTRDLEGVASSAKEDIVKEKGSQLTHISDALGYYVHEVYPCGGRTTTVRH